MLQERGAVGGNSESDSPDIKTQVCQFSGYRVQQGSGWTSPRSSVFDVRTYKFYVDSGEHFLCIESEPYTKIALRLLSETVQISKKCPENLNIFAYGA